MAERDAQAPVLAEHARRQALDREAEVDEELGEQAVQLVAEAAAPAANDLVEQPVGAKPDLLAGVDAEVLERHRQEVRELEIGENGRGRFSRAPVADPRQICRPVCSVHDVEAWIPRAAVHGKRRKTIARMTAIAR